MPTELIEFSKERISERIRYYREKAGMTQSQLGLKLGVGKTQISKLERNPINMGVETIVKVFAALGVSISIQLKTKTISPDENSGE